jgi:hypothetical protein
MPRVAGGALARQPGPLHYKDQKTRILSFAEFLGPVAGRVPILVEKSAGGAPHRIFSTRSQSRPAYAGPIT